MRYSTIENIILTDGTSDYVDYTLYNNSSLVFSGRAYKYPDAQSLAIDVTDICHSIINAPYIDSSSGHVSTIGRSASFTLYGNITHSFTVNYWTKYNMPIPQGAYSNNDPISRTIDPRQYLYPGSVNASITITKNGASWYSGIGGTITQLALSGYGLINGTKLQLTCGSTIIDYVIKCGANYALYYQNPVGGIDSVTCYGPCTRRSSVTRYSISNKNAEFFKNENKAIEATIGWNLVTGSMTDIESEHIPDLLLSNCCWLHDLNTGDLYPVNVTNSDIESKTKKKDKNNTSYNIQVALAQTITAYN